MVNIRLDETPSTLQGLNPWLLQQYGPVRIVVYNIWQLVDLQHFKLCLKCHTFIHNYSPFMSS